MTGKPLEGSYIYYRDGEYSLVVIADGKTYEWPMEKQRVLRLMSSGLEAMKKQETGSGWVGDL